MENQNYQQMFEQLNEMYGQLEKQSNIIINELQISLKQSKNKNEMLTRQILDLKEKRKNFNTSIERQIEMAQRQRNQFKKKFIEFQKKVIQLEIVNESLQSQLRAHRAQLSQYQTRIQKTMQQFTLAQIQLQQSTSTNQQQVARLKGQLKQTQEQLFSIHHIKDKYEEVKKKDEQQKKQIFPSQITISDNNASKFRDTLKQIRQYICTIDSKKLQFRKKFLKI